MKRITVLFSCVMAVMVAASSLSFAVTDSSNPERIDTAAELKQELTAALEDGVVSTNEQKTLEENTSAEAVEAFLYEKMDMAIAVLNDQTSENDLMSLEDGEAYKKEVLDLGDGCRLTVELSDEAVEDEKMARATSGSNTLWKNYGSRYFTASTTVSFPLGGVTMKLRNYYILSSKGIDEERGKGTLIYDCIGGSYSVSQPKITDAIARTVGASDVNMECRYTLEYDNLDDIPVKRVYKITSTVGFVDIDKAEEKVKVKQSWKLTRLT